MRARWLVQCEHRGILRVKNRRFSSISCQPNPTPTCTCRIIHVSKEDTTQSQGDEDRSPEKPRVLKVVRWPILRNSTELQGFLGLCAGLRQWIEGYSKVARPLNRLLVKSALWIWGDEEQDALDKLKELVSASPCIHPIHNQGGREVILAVDSSFIAVGCIFNE